MTNSIFSNPIFFNEDKAIQHLESVMWPEGPVCPHCGDIDNATKINGKSARKGLWSCISCRKQFTVMVGSIFHGSHTPIHKWLIAVYLMCSSKKGISSHQLHRTLGVTYKTAWFMSHRIREAMKGPEFSGQLGGADEIVEADETFWGREDGVSKAKAGWAHKLKIFSLVERGGSVRSFHVKRVTGETLKPILREQVNSDTRVITDDMGAYSKLNRSFDKHDVICHSKGEYKRGKDIHTNTIEGYFSILKRGLDGIYQHVMSHHLKRYITEFDFRYSHRKVTDIERFNIALRMSEGKRLLYT